MNLCGDCTALVQRGLWSKVSGLRWSWIFHRSLRKIFPRFSLRLILPPGLSYVPGGPVASQSTLTFFNFKNANIPFISAILVCVSIGDVASFPHQVFQILHDTKWQSWNIKLSRTTTTHPPTNSHRDKSNLDEPPIANFEAELQERILDLTTIPGKRICGWHQGPGIGAGRSLSQGPNGGSKVPARVP